MQPGRSREAQTNSRLAYSSAGALALAFTQFSVIRFSPFELAVRIVVPATIAAVPLALWPFRGRAGTWVIFVGLAANLAVILANGGLMPIQHSTLVEAVGETSAAQYETGHWVRGSKDMLVGAHSGRLVALGDGIIIRLGSAGIVASPGDLVVWAGLAVLAGEASIAVQRGRRRASADPTRAELAAPAGAEGGAATRT